MPESRDAAADDDLDAEARERIADLVDLQPTKNAELQDRWDMDSGSEVHRYLESTLSAYYYRDEDSLVRPTARALALLGEDPADAFAGRTVELTPFQRDLLAALPGPDAATDSVVAVLHRLQNDGDDHGADAERVRKTLRRLERRGLVDVEHRAVPTFRRAVDLDAVDVEVTEE